ncbi:MAG: phospholipase D-like domain-containing protein [Methanobacteriaceae archaeon]
MQILNKPLYPLFMDLVKNTEESINLCSPFVKENVISKIYNNSNSEIDLKLVTNININNFYKKASDLSAMKEILENNNQIFNYQQLHAKIYIFDSQTAIITSGNLTYSGLNKNYEYGVLIDENDGLNTICNDFDYLCNCNLSGTIDLENINEIDSILKTIPQSESVKIPKFESKSNNDDSIFKEDVSHIIQTLKGWKRSIFEVLNSFDDINFNINTVYEYIPQLQIEYPNNKNIKPKIRQVLQQLRDLGLVKFEGEGIYKKLWG